MRNRLFTAPSTFRYSSDATSGHHLWAERYEGAIEGIFEFQDQVLDQIVANLAVELVGADMAGGSGPAGTDVVAAYDALLTGRKLARRRSPGDFSRAIIWFEKAIELDPNYGSAYAAIAGAYWNIVSLDWHFSVGTAWDHAYERMLTNLAKAKEMPTGYAYAVSTEILARHGRYDEALADAERGLALEPNNPEIGFPLRSPIRSRSVLKTHKKTPMYGLISTHSYRIGNKGKFHNHES